MKKLIRIVLVLAALLTLGVVGIILLTPWMDRWGATEEEIAATFPGDELVPDPASFVNRAVAIQASPEQIYPWIAQLGAGRGGFYSYSWLDNHLLRCELADIHQILPEFQDPQVGDEVKMCENESAPPPYIVAQVLPNEALVLGHQEDGEWVDLWQFVIRPQADGSSRLVLRTRTQMVGGVWTIIHPGVFVMERGMLLGIKERAEGPAQTD